MNTIVITSKPEQGNRQRACHVCAEPYQGFNMVHCGCAVKPYRVVEAWRGTSYEVP